MQTIEYNISVHGGLTFASHCMQDEYRNRDYVTREVTDLAKQLMGVTHEPAR